MPNGYINGVIFLLFGLASSLPFAGDAKAGVAFFRETCVAAVKNFAMLETRLPALGMTETQDIPSAVLPHPRSTRTWISHQFPGVPGDGFVQLIAGSDTEPVDACRHVSRPGESATEALAQLQALYPPVERSVRSDNQSLSGLETWVARVDGVAVIFRVGWPFRSDPSSGTSDLSIVKPRGAQPAE